ncbi:hypothetical protein [Streptococcus massiliensis]|uniref:hypothetical protein n=1 Tax=Streptococcus massiliensis TaxID=313439 RepID=UPI00034546C0|nr:hypothetical protein [Streptococcus massiliensis]
MIKAIFYEHKERYESVRITQERLMLIINVSADGFMSFVSMPKEVAININTLTLNVSIQL